MHRWKRHVAAPPIAVLSSIIAMAALAAQSSTPVVSVTGGQLRGTASEQGAVFKGIRFAEPPVGAWRWREARPAMPWRDVRDATAFGPPCAQRDNGSGFAADAARTGSEDCLFLNVWTPAWPVRQRLPVMVWIHGGGNFAGAGASDLFGDGSGNTYDGSSLARHGVVVVTINYRLGTLGFFAHPELSKESPHGVSGNYGLLDQIAALKWIRDNIARFGGDPRNVTLFGQSSGATDIGALMTSPLAKGLFHRGIAQSGVVLGEPRTLATAEADGLRMAAALKAPAHQSLTHLRGLSAAEIVNALEPLFPAAGRASMRHLVVDGYAVPRSPARVFNTGQQHALPLLIGSNARERSPGLTALPTDLAATIRQSYGPLAERAIALYGSAPPDALYGTPAEQWAGDVGFRCDSSLQALWHAAAGHTTYQYEFSRSAPEREAIGAVHNAEIWYVFGTLRLGTGPAGPKPLYDDVDRTVSAAIQGYWTNFAKRGDPNGGMLARWPAFTPVGRSYLRLGDRPEVHTGLRRPFCDLYAENVAMSMAR